MGYISYTTLVIAIFVLKFANFVTVATGIGLSNF